jgi:hypothetical protein
VKRTKGRVPEGRMIAQAEQQGRLERKPWVLVIAGHNDRKPIATLELSVLLDALRAAGWVPSLPPPAGQRSASSADALF